MKIKFVCAAWPTLRNMDTGFLKTLKKYGAQVVEDRADIIIYENKTTTQEDALVKIFITGENNVPSNVADFDLIFVPRECSGNSYLLPLWTFSVDWDNEESDWSVKKLQRSRQDSFTERKTRFCGFVSCKERAYRVNFVQMLSKYKPVICAGKVLNNCDMIGPGKDNKKEFLQTCKFAIAFENEGGNNYQGYVTEKIIDAFVARTVPIYWGDPTITKVFNPKAFLNRHDYSSDQEFIQAIIDIDTNDEKYFAMQREPAILEIPSTLYPERICEKIINLFENAPRIRFFYGAQDIIVDVTKLATTLFIDTGKITITADTVFNGLFGDVLPGVPKFLTIRNYYNGAVTTLPEVRENDYVALVLQKSETDIYTTFTQACRRIVAGSIVDWKKHVPIVHMLEHESVQNASTYLKELENHLSVDLIVNLTATNDLIGSASVHDFTTNKGLTILASPTSMRYVKHAFDILTLAEKKIGNNLVKLLTVVEVGGGYGGLALTLAKLSSHFGISICKHIIYDLEEVTNLQKYYLAQHNKDIHNVVWANAKTFGQDICSHLEENSHVLLVSNYCMSEIDAKYRTQYLRNLTPHVQSVYMRWNLHSHNDLPVNYKIEPEIPDTGRGNTIVTF